ncbi:POL1 [Sanghuangporus weigelae]
MSDRRKNASKLEKFAAYKRAREGGGRNWKPEEDGDLYDEVDEEQYKSIVKGRLQKDDFIVDDGVEGYADNGMDDWADDQPIESDEEVKPRAKKKMKVVKAKPVALPPVAPTFNDYKPKPSAATEDDFMASLLGNMENVTPDTQYKSRKRKPRDLSPPQTSSPDENYFNGYRANGGFYTDASSDGPADDFSTPPSDDADTGPFKRPRRDDADVLPTVQKFEDFAVDTGSDVAYDTYDDSFNDVDMDDFAQDEKDVKPKVEKSVKMEIDDVDLLIHRQNAVPKVQEVKADKGEDETPSWLSVHDSLTVKSEDTLGPLAGTSANVRSSSISALEEDGSLRFFWLDYLEQDGKVYFIGKLKDKTTGTWISSCITVENLDRNLFLLPRERKIEDGYETDVIPTTKDVHADFDAIRKKAGIKTFKAKPVKRSYAFGESDVPTREHQWMKIVYPFSARVEPQLPDNVTSPSIARIFGTKTSAFELLVLKRKIMGPCWLEIKNPHIEHKGISWCKFEAVVSDPKDINPFSETDTDAPKETPPLTVMSLTVRTIVNHTENKREVVCATARTWTNLDIDDPTPPDQLPCAVHTLVRPLDKFPAKFQAACLANKKGIISAEANERMLLNRLLVTIYKSDPDVIVGHDFLGVSLDVLLTRMRDLKADNWSRIGRFRRTRWPNIGRQGTNMKFLNGRLLCDLASDGAKGMISSTTWSLTEMCSTHLKCEREDIDPDDVANYFDGSLSTPDRLMKFVRHCELDAHYQMAIAARVQILPLTKQLTNLAGNSWNKTLNGGRAERNEYILLHEFHRLKYICPDKTWGKKSAAAVKVEAEEGDGAAATTHKSKKDKYKGGLVFEPKRGLWDKYILVMDFNSLYPSIIQEYNIDFTTVERVASEEGKEEKIPEPPSPDVPQGVLPRLIATLVGRRRQVKSLMKDKSITQAKYLQYDIKQQALKLTANSMYGCLGFEYSRFYARPLAALTTFKGREILTHTRELAESLQLDVVYGDTDSVFVNSNATDFVEALKVASEFKKQVNEQYKLLEIDLDGVFKRLLLLQKKKYAALKMEDATRTSVEVKGLDMKRREYCMLSKDASQYLLDKILSGEATETVVEQIHEYLSKLGEDVRSGKIGLDKFIIFKRLGKNPEDYPDAKSQPHVTVALRMKSKGQSARAGDVIPYIFCLSDSGESNKSGQADKAHHPDELRRSNGVFQIDFEYYLSQQILPPIERLCEPIEGTDRARLAECLGLDPGRFRSYVGGDSEERAFGTLESQMPDSVRFKDCDPLTFRCRKCSGEMPFTHISRRDTSILHTSGPICAGCQAPLNPASMQVQLENQIREHISRYYEGWTVCDDATCRNRTRMMGVYGRRCLKRGCKGAVAFEYSDNQLYTQLMYYANLLDVEKVREASKSSPQKSTIEAALQQNHTLLKDLHGVVQKYLSQCGRRYVDLGSLFSFMKV